MSGNSPSRSLSTLQLGLVWFAASVSLAEILTGTFFAPLGFERGLAAIVIGHVIGSVLFWLVGYVSAREGLSAMEAVARPFGRAGAKFFAVANVVQLVGWTAIMVMSGASAADLLVPELGMPVWALAIGALIVVWIAIGTERMGTVQSVASLFLLALTAVVGFAVFGGGAPGAGAGVGVVDAAQAAAEGDAGALSFGAAVELAVAMPLSWLPVVGDYTREARRAGAGAAAATGAYFLGSCWMFVIGLGCALLAGSDDVAAVLAQAGLGVVGILVVVFSTVTTTFLDAQSAGISAHAIHPRLDARACGIIAAVVGTVLAIVAPVADFEEFLYLIGSVFAPMAALVIVDCLFLRRDRSDERLNVRNAILWVAGFALYRFSLGWDIPCGNTLPVMAIIIACAFVAGKTSRRAGKP